MGHQFLFCHFQAVPAEASEEVTKNSVDGAEAAAPIPAPSPKTKKKHKSGKTITSVYAKDKFYVIPHLLFFVILIPVYKSCMR